LDAKHGGKAEIVAFCPRFVIKTGFVRGDDAAALADECGQLIALPAVERGDVRQNQGLKLANMRRVQETVVHHLKGNARLNERLIPAVDMVLHRAAMEPGRLL